jgi:hypothetical protein
MMFAMRRPFDCLLSRVPANRKIAGRVRANCYMSPERADALIAGAERAASAAKIAMRVVRPTPFIIFKLICVELPPVISCNENGRRKRSNPSVMSDRLGALGFYSCSPLLPCTAHGVLDTTFHRA